MCNPDNPYHLHTVVVGAGGGGKEQEKNNCNNESQKATRPDFRRKALITNEILRRDEGVPAYLR